MKTVQYTNVNDINPDMNANCLRFFRSESEVENNSTVALQLKRQFSRQLAIKTFNSIKANFIFSIKFLFSIR